MANTVYKAAYLPVVLGDAGAWGGELNTQTFPIFDSALGGYAAVSVSNANISLSAGQDQQAILRVTGTLGANVQITSACQGFKIVENLTTGAYTLTITNGVGTPLTLPQGVGSFVIFDVTNGARLGTPVYTAVTNLSVPGDLSVTGNSAFGGYTTFADIATPSAPSAGLLQLYATSGGTLALQTPTGQVSAVGLSTASAQGLTVTYTSTTASITVASALLTSSSGFYSLYSGGTLAVNTNTTGAGGLDTGARASSTWYYFYIISNGTTVAGLASTSATSPTLPAGYNFFIRVSANITDGSSNFYIVKQKGRDAQYVVGSSGNTTAFPQAASGVAGSPIYGTWVAVNLTSILPSTATRVRGSLYVGGGGGGHALIAPNNNFGGYSSTTKQPPVVINTNGYLSASFDLTLENALSTGLYWASDTSYAVLSIIGWSDSVMAC